MSAPSRGGGSSGAGSGGGGSSARSGSQPAATRPPPAPPLIGPTGSPSLDCMADAINSTFAPFQNAPPPEQGAAGWVAQGLGGVVGLVGAPAQIIDSAFAGLTAPIAAMFPAMPAITLLGMHIGSLHAHTHPPSLIPPAPPVPLPSIGMLVGAGAMTVHGGGLPLARAGDIGISVTCGSLAPPFEVYTGSSNVFVGGARAARLLDITKHCNPTSMGPFDIAMGVAGVAAGAAGAIAANSAAAAAQAAADAAVLAIKLLCGKDPGIPPGMGALVGPPVPNVLIGGFPCPPVGDMVIGALMKGLKKLVAAVKKMRAARRGNANCGDGSHPIYLVTGENFDSFTDFVSPGLFRWQRHYTSARAEQPGPLGYGFRHIYQRELDLRLHKAKFTDWDGVTLEFPKFEAGSDLCSSHGYVLRRVDRTRYELSTHGQPTMVFAGDLFTEILPLVALRSETHELRFGYDEQRRLIGAEDWPLSAEAAARRRYALRYDSRGRIVALDEYDERGQAKPRFAASYSEAGELSYARDANNGLWAYAYDARHRWTRQVDPRGYGYSFEYDDQGRCVHARGDDGLWEARAEYLPEQAMTRYVEGEGAVWEYHHDKDGFITKIVNPQGGARVRVRDAEGKILEEIDPGGRALTYVYDEDGANIGRRDRFGYVHPPESQTTALLDAFARTLPQTSLARTFAAAVPAAPAAALGATGQLLLIPAELRRLAHGLFRMRPAGAPALAYGDRVVADPLGHPIAEVDGLNRTRRRSYDAAGNELAYQDRDGRIYRREITSWNLVTARADPLGHTRRYAYDTLEQMTQLTDPAGNVTRWVYDRGQRLTQVWAQGQLRDRYEYDEGDRLVAKYDGEGELVFRNTEFCAASLVTRRELASGGEHLFDYDARGHLTEASTASHSIRLGQDSSGVRLLDLRDGEGVERWFCLDHEHVDLLGRFGWRREVLPGAVRIRAPNGGSFTIHDGGDGVALRECSNGTREWLQYDHEGQLEGRMSARANAAGQHVGWGVRYTYSPEGDLLSVSDSVRGIRHYQVDEAHRLVGETTPAGEQLRYAFDELSNLVHAPALSRLHLGPGNLIEGTATERFEHDGRARLIHRLHRDGPRTRYRYDSFDMLEAVEMSAGADPAAEPRIWRAGYDAIGRRLWTELDGRRREFYWDGDRLAAELDPEGKLRIYLYADHDALVALAFVDYDSRDAAPDSGRLYHVFCDGAGLPLHIEDDQREIVWWASAASPWGHVQVHEGARVEYNLRWPGHYRDPETGLHYNRYRYYDPQLGRYLTPDPTGYRGSELNLYAYCANPLVQVDLLGLTHRRSPTDGADQHPQDVDGTTRPPGDDAGDGPDSGMHYTREEAAQVARDAANDHRLFVAQERAAGRIEHDPACTAAVVDRRTGKVFVAHNEPKGAVANPENFHPLLADRVTHQQDRLAMGEDHFSEPGTHAEVLALNDALNARQAQQRDTPLTHADLAEFTQAPVWAREGLPGNRTPGTDAACCGHCAPITRGTHNLSGDAVRFTDGPPNGPKWRRAE